MRNQSFYQTSVKPLFYGFFDFLDRGEKVAKWRLSAGKRVFGNKLCEITTELPLFCHYQFNWLPLFCQDKYCLTCKAKNNQSK
jgi:hypothetical protein